jgi:hypothetical protein
VLADDREILLCRELALAKALSSNPLRHAGYEFGVRQNKATARARDWLQILLPVAEGARWPLRARTLRDPICDPQRGGQMLIWVPKASQRPSHTNDVRKVDGLGGRRRVPRWSCAGGVGRVRVVEKGAGAGWVCKVQGCSALRVCRASELEPIIGARLFGCWGMQPSPLEAAHLLIVGSNSHRRCMQRFVSPFAHTTLGHALARCSSVVHK